MKLMIVENSLPEMQNRTGHKHSIQLGFSLLKNVTAIFCLVAISIGVFGTSEVLAVQDNRLKEDQMIRILLPESSVVEKETYRLGDIARLEGPDPYLIERLERIKIGRSPLPGRDLSVSRSIMLHGSDRQKSTQQRLSFLPAKTHAFNEQHSRFLARISTSPF